MASTVRAVARTGRAVPRILDPECVPRVSANGLYMLRFRYLARREDGSFEEPVEMFRRVAWNLAGAERLLSRGCRDDQVLARADEFFTAMTDFRFLPNAPTLLGAGRPLQQLSACYVLPVGDSIDEIFETLRMAAVVHSKGSGTGFSFSRLRPRGAAIASGGVASGPVPFLRVFDAETEVLKSGGTGWGANMGVLRCDHPDIRDFVTAKSDRQGLQNFNISVGVTDRFVELCRSGGQLPLVDPRTGTAVGSTDAKELLDLIAREAWKTGDPGLLFLDRIERDNPTPALGSLEATNPCGEAPLLPFEACWLGGINVVAHFEEAVGDVSWSDLQRTCWTAARMMDNAIEVNHDPLPQIQAATRRTRKIGIGVMGFADLLIRMGVRYGSSESESIARRLMRTIRSTLDEATVALAEERGAFPALGASIFSRAGARPRRNATMTANAPNSTISVIAGCSQGIEPLFSIAFTKLLADGTRLQELSPELIRLARQHGCYSSELVEAILGGAPIQALRQVPDDMKRLFVTAQEVSVADHIRIQGAFQDYTELAVAKTVNLPRSARPEDVAEAFLLAHRSGCKGITCFRDGCREKRFLHSPSVGAAELEATACATCR